MSDGVDSVKDFLTRVLPWPGPDEPGYCNIHWLVPSSANPERKFWVGKPTRNVDDFLRWQSFILGLPDATDLYFCLSRQKHMKTNKAGKPAAMRTQDGADALKAIWLDVDVKEPPKGYATLPEALGAIKEFRDKTGLPKPSALIASGGGVHVYWFSDRPLTPQEWQPYANGLKNLAIEHGLRCDAGVTIDSARVLRPPGTWNCKGGQKRPVQILGKLGNAISFDADLSWLRELGARLPAARHSAGPGAVGGGGASEFDPAIFPKKTARVTESLSDGVKYPPLSITGLARKGGCEFVRQALKTGGKEYSQPEWNLTTLLSTFLEGGHERAHDMARKHPGYSAESTDELWDRKTRERRDKGLGWPSCSAIQAAGCASCAACPHLAKRKSPLNLALEEQTHELFRVNGHKVEVAGDLHLPEGYQLNDQGQICYVKTVTEKGEESYDILLPIFYCKLSDPMAYRTPDALAFFATMDMGRKEPITLMQAEFGPHKILEAMNNYSVKYVPENKMYIERFIMAWMNKLHNTRESQLSVPFGWYEIGEAVHGFAYGGIVYKEDGTEMLAGHADITLRADYSPQGEEEAWQDAIKMICDQQRGDLQTLAAVAFAAPLIKFTGEYSCCVSAWTSNSGSGKSTACKVGLGVWANPKRSRETIKSTERYLLGKAGELRHLPLYRDEITDAIRMESVYATLWDMGDGTSPGRLNSNSSMKSRTDWQTMMVVCSNSSFVDFIIQKQKTTEAGAMRVLEFEAPRVEIGPGRIDTITASRIVQRLEHNYGRMGSRYARILGTDHVRIKDMVKAKWDKFNDELKLKQEERYWSAGAAVLVTGAILAKELGVPFDIGLIEKHLVNTIEMMRVRVSTSNVDGKTKFSTEETLSQYLKLRTPETCTTRNMPQFGKPGKPRPTEVITGPNPPNARGVNVQWAIDDRTLLLSCSNFEEYLTREQKSISTVLAGLRSHFGMYIRQGTLAAGTPYRTVPERLMVIPISSGSTLEPMLSAHARPAEPQGGDNDPQGRADDRAHGADQPAAPHT